MSRIHKPCICKCEEKVKVIEDNLLLLKNLLVKEDLLIEGNLLVKGRISNDALSQPSLICTTGISTSDPFGMVFNINQSNPCQLIIQGHNTIIPSRIIYGLQTPDGTYLVINYSSHANIVVEEASNPGTPVFTIRPANNNEPVVARLVIRNGVLIQRSIVSPPNVGGGAPGCVAVGPNGRIFGAPQCAVTFPNGQQGFLFTQSIGVTASASTIIFEADTSGLLRIINRSLQQTVNILNAATGERAYTVAPNTQADITLQDGHITNIVTTNL